MLERLYHVKSALVQIGNHPDSLYVEARALARQIDRLLRAILVAFECQWDDVSRIEDGVRRDIETQLLIDETTDVIDEVSGKLLPVLEGSRSENIPMHLMMLVTSEVAEVAGSSDLRVVISSDYSYNYSVQSYRFDRWYELLERGGQDYDEVVGASFLLLTLPRLERDSCPLHAALLGHELGHLRVWQSSLLAKLDTSVPDGIPVLEKAENDTAKESIRELCGGLLVSYLSELAADVFAALTYGPAALLALAELTSGGTLAVRTDSKTHPSAARRVSVILRTLETLGFADIASVAATLDRYRSVAAFEHESAEVIESVWPLVAAQVDQLLERCSEVVPNHSRFGADRWPEVLAAVAQLEKGRTVGEAVDPNAPTIDPAVIINAGWLCKGGDLSALASTTGVDATTVSGLLRLNSILDQLVLKSFEIVSYRQARQQ